MLRYCRVVAFAASLFLGCGTLCDRAHSTAASFTQKALPCGATDRTPDFSRAACESGIASCTERDRQTIVSYLDCLDRLPACEPGKASEFSAAVLACADPMVGVAERCFWQ
jgi:hypothetical protein